MNDESFVRIPSSTLNIIYGQIGNVRVRLMQLDELLDESVNPREKALVAEAATELEFLESYLPGSVADIPF